jgi:hypothetical protein
VTYIVGVRALRRPTGLVISADSQETIGGELNYVEKLAASSRVVVAGAGRAELVEGFCQHMLEAFEDYPDSLADEAEALSLIRSALKGFYANDVRLLPGRKKSVEFIIGASLDNGTSGMWRTKGIRSFVIPHYESIGWESPFVRHLARSLYSEELDLGQAVLLSILLVVAAKKTTDGVGGDTALAVITSNGVDLKEKGYISEAEERLSQLEESINEIRVACSDLSLHPNEFKDLISQFQEKAERLRTHYSERMVSSLLSRGLDYTRTSPYAELPTGKLGKADRLVIKYKEVDRDKWGISTSASSSPSASPSPSEEWEGDNDDQG